MDLGSVDGQHLDADQSGLRAQPEDLAEQVGQRPLVTLTETRDRRVIRRLVGGDDPHRDVLDAAPLDPPRRPLPDRVAVHQQRQHHRRLVCRTTVTILAIDRIERREVHRLDRVDDKPRQAILGQPLAQRRRQQQLLVAITADEVLRHHRRVLTPPDRPLYATATDESGDYGFPTDRFDCYAQAALVCPDKLVAEVDEFVAARKAAWSVEELQASELGDEQLVEVAEFIAGSRLSLLARIVHQAAAAPESGAA
jgi:hypothetical protein